MAFASPLFRSIAVSSTLLAAAASSQAAGLTIPTATWQANSVLAFSADTLKAFNLRFISVTVAAKGNTVASTTTPGVYTLPITSISVSSSLKIAGGAASGSALQITRLNDNGDTVGFTLANFVINYETKQVLADATPLHGTTVAQLPVYTFNTATPLALKYKFPLTITGHEVLNTLFLTTAAKTFFMDTLALPEAAKGLLDTTDFGTLTQDINTSTRKPAISAKAYVPAP
jgi:hypothetical protein